MKTKKSWREKLADSKDLPKVIPIPVRMKRKWGDGTIVIPAPVEVDGMMRLVPKGKLTTINDIRVALAQKHGATIGCPMTTGIFAWIAAHAAHEAAAEQLARRSSRTTPYWRTLKTGGLLNEKYPGSIADQRRRLQAEGHQVKKQGKSYVVENFERKLIAWEKLVK